MVHLRSYHTRIEEVEKSYSVSYLRDILEDIAQDRDALYELFRAVKKRDLALGNIEFFQVILIKQSHDYSHNNRIVFYVSRDLYAKDDGREIYVNSHDHKSFLWKERKDAFAYAKELSDTHHLPLRDLTVKKAVQ